MRFATALFKKSGLVTKLHKIFKLEERWEFLKLPSTKVNFIWKMPKSRSSETPPWAGRQWEASSLNGQPGFLTLWLTSHCMWMLGSSLSALEASDFRGHFEAFSRTPRLWYKFLNGKKNPIIRKIICGDMRNGDMNEENKVWIHWWARDEKSNFSYGTTGYC